LRGNSLILRHLGAANLLVATLTSKSTASANRRDKYLKEDGPVRYYELADRGHKVRPAKLRGMRTYNISGDHTTSAEGVDLWAKEARGYDIRSNTCSGACLRPLHADCMGRDTCGGLGCAVATDRWRKAITIHRETS
jgi:hypothetical protein